MIAVDGEYAFLVYLYRMHYPGTLASLQNVFGQDFSQISKIFLVMVEFMDVYHRGKVIGNLRWYSNRFNNYNASTDRKIATSPSSPSPGNIPIELSNLVGFIDGTSRHINRPGGFIQQFFGMVIIIKIV